MKDYWKAFRSWPIPWQIGTAVGGVWFLVLLIDGAAERWHEREYWLRFIGSLLN